jgi:hypothetical protein
MIMDGHPQLIWGPLGQGRSSACWAGFRASHMYTRLATVRNSSQKLSKLAQTVGFYLVLFDSASHPKGAVAVGSLGADHSHAAL